jgi:hypothetical protein
MPVLRATAVLMAAALLTPATLPGQGEPAPRSIDEWIEQVRSATKRYQDQSVAISDGYKRMGPDVPSMGQHWIALPRIGNRLPDPRQPPILEYASIDGKPRLIGVAYALLLPEGVELDAGVVPAPASAWRYYHGEISEDALVLNHADSAPQPIVAIPRLAVLHAWVWQHNPDGVFASDNWSLPYVRLGLRAPPEPRPTQTTLALALAAGGEQYFHTLLRMRYQPRPSEQLRTGGILARYAQSIRASVTVERRDTSDVLSQWQAMDVELRAACPSCARREGPVLGFTRVAAPLP